VGVRRSVLRFSARFGKVADIDGTVKNAGKILDVDEIIELLTVADQAGDGIGTSLGGTAGIVSDLCGIRSDTRPALSGPGPIHPSVSGALMCFATIAGVPIMQGLPCAGMFQETILQSTYKSEEQEHA